MRLTWEKVGEERGKNQRKTLKFLRGIQYNSVRLEKMCLMELKVKLEVFEGPLDLLLHLLDKNKVSIYDIPIVEITEPISGLYPGDAASGSEHYE